MLHTLLPTQAPQRIAELAGPQRRLMMAVLMTALHDCLTVVAIGDDMRRRARRQALDFLESRDRSWPYSFENICDATGLDAAGIRRTLRRRAGADA
jgi:hypothetical protein